MQNNDMTLFGGSSQGESTTRQNGTSAPYVAPSVQACRRGEITLADEIFIAEQSEDVRALFARIMEGDDSAISRADESGYERGYATGHEEGMLAGKQAAAQEQEATLTSERRTGYESGYAEGFAAARNGGSETPKAA